jgi:hypothetical protein
MTTNVPKGAGRATATAKRTKHAQRTLLPPKAGSPGAVAVEAAKCEGGEEAHFAHLDANGECPWNHGETDSIPEVQRAVQQDNVKPMGEMTVAELRSVASKLGVPGYKVMRRGDLLNAILEAERAKTSTAERLAGRNLAEEAFKTAEKSKPARPATSVEKPLTKPQKEVMEIVADRGYVDRQVLANWKGSSSDSPAITSVLKALVRRGILTEPDSNYGRYLPVDRVSPEPECTGEQNVPLTEAQGKSMAKAEAFLKAAAELGWGEFARSAPEQETYGVIVGRGEERITISWRAGVFIGEECYHSHPGRSPRKVINASAAKKIMAIPAAQAAEEAAKVSAHKLARPRRDRSATATTAPRKALPFDPETAPDEDVIRAVSGHQISWTNEISGAIDESYVKGSIDEISIQPGKSGRSIRFTSAEGFRSVRVSSIVAIR